MPSHHTVFLREFVRNYQTTGAVAPSSRWLAKALTRALAEPGPAPQRRAVLEVGPGTGAVTQQLVTRLAPHDRLTLVELNDTFVAHLRARFANDPAWKEAAPRTEIVHDRLENLDPSVRFDVIVSGLPLNNFSIEQVADIIATFRRLLAPNGVLSFFEYMAIRRARCVVGRPSDRERMQGISRVVNELLIDGQARREWVWVNMPPAWVYHVSGSCATSGLSPDQVPQSTSSA
ncbi:MAG TPA: methyltransferase domain-containing protein [Pirellulales bacterium]|nr:methyltransferase domain-containing protein [Pirellulales bacterium]